MGALIKNRHLDIKERLRRIIMKRRGDIDMSKVKILLEQLDYCTKRLIETLDASGEEISSIDIEFWKEFDKDITVRFWDGDSKQYCFNNFSTHWSNTNLHVEDIIDYVKSREILFRKFK